MRANCRDRQRPFPSGWQADFQACNGISIGFAGSRLFSSDLKAGKIISIRSKYKEEREGGPGNKSQLPRQAEAISIRWVG